MRHIVSKLLITAVLFGLLVNVSGCAALKKKFTRKKKEAKQPTYYQVRKYDIKPSMELYEKHYVFWINWQRKLLDELGKNFKNDKRCIQEITGNLGDMASLLVDEKRATLLPHINELKKVRVIIDKRTMTTSNQTRIRRILEREYRVVKREFSPKKMTGFIRKEWKAEAPSP